MPCLLNFSVLHDLTVFGTASSKTATALNHLPLYPLYLTSSEQFASSSSCSALAIETPLLCNHGLLLFLPLFGSLLPILLLPGADAGVRPDSGVRGPRPTVVG